MYTILITKHEQVSESADYLSKTLEKHDLNLKLKDNVLHFEVWVQKGL